MSLTLKFALFTFLVCVAVLSGVSFLHYRDARADLEQALGEKLEAIVRTAAGTINGTQLDLIHGPEDEQSEAFQTIQAQLKQFRDANELGDLIYCMRREGEDMVFLVMTHDKPFIGDHYEIREAMLPTLNKGQPNRTGVYQDKNGYWISAYAPILDEEGHLSGLLEADYEVNTFLERLKAQEMQSWLFGGGFALVAALLSFVVASSLTRKIKYLTELTEKISLGKMNVPVEVKGKDEVAKLGSALERMRESLRIASELIDD